MGDGSKDDTIAKGMNTIWNTIDEFDNKTNEEGRISLNNSLLDEAFSHDPSEMTASIAKMDHSNIEEAPLEELNIEDERKNDMNNRNPRFFNVLQESTASLDFGFRL